MKKLFVALTLSVMPFFAFAMDGNEIIKKASLVSYYAGDDGMAQMLMKTYSKSGKKTVEEVILHRQKRHRRRW